MVDVEFEDRDEDERLSVAGFAWDWGWDWDLASARACENIWGFEQETAQERMRTEGEQREHQERQLSLHFAIGPQLKISSRYARAASQVSNV
jgi:hypothetical protein